MDLIEEYADVIKLLENLKESAVNNEKYFLNLPEDVSQFLQFCDAMTNMHSLVEDLVTYVFHPSEEKVLDWIFDSESEHYYISASEFLQILDDDWQCK